MTQPAYSMSNTTTSHVDRQYLQQVTTQSLGQQPDLDVSNQNMPMTLPVAEQSAVFQSLYETYSHAADDQHASSFVLDYLLDFNAELNQYEIRSNPEAQRIFLEIEFVTYVLKNNVIKAYRQITSEFRH
ncbi:hypothetical protein I2F62_12835, partial [Acinetobacter sp. MD2(2019)]|nr:hypothetical protein [Acinetobacter sp. MD2(2019)]